MTNVEDLREALAKKRRPYDRLVEEDNSRQERKTQLERQDVYYRDRETYWNRRASELEQEAQKARGKAQKAVERRERAERVLAGTDWLRDEPERLERHQQIQIMEQALAQIETILAAPEPRDPDMKKDRQKKLDKLEKEFRSAKGKGV